MKGQHLSVLKRPTLLMCAGVLLFLLTGCSTSRNEAEPTGSSAGGSIQVFLDDSLWNGSPAVETTADDLMVRISCRGQLLISLPFSESHLITVHQPDGSENTVLMTGSMVRMMDANCSNHDCMEMGEITRDNLDERILGGFIVCLPHDLIVEVRNP